MSSSSLARRWARLAIGLGLLTALQSAQAYSNLVVFGDSLSDSGNNALVVGTDPGQVLGSNSSFAIVPYASGTYSNGQVWAQQLASRLGLAASPSLAGGSIYAFGGAETSAPGPLPGGFPYSLSTQLGMFMADRGGVADAEALYVVAGGGNNVRAALDAIVAGADPGLTAQALVQGYVNDIGGIVDSLQASGAQHIVVWNTPNFGLTPLARSQGAAGSLLATELSFAMNAALSQRLAGEAVQTFDVFGLLSSVVAQGPASGFSNWTDACGAPSAGCDPGSALFYDGIHPTTVAHGMLADAMFAAVVPEPASSGLMLLGLGSVLLLSRRRLQGTAATVAAAAAPHDGADGRR